MPARRRPLRLARPGPAAALLLGAALALAGCASVRTTRPDGRVVVHHFGYVREERPPSSGGAHVAAFSSLGLRLDQAFTLGLWESRVETLPFDDRIVLRVANQAQLEAALQALSALPTHTTPCVIVDPPR